MTLVLMFATSYITLSQFRSACYWQNYLRPYLILLFGHQILKSRQSTWSRSFMNWRYPILDKDANKKISLIESPPLPNNCANHRYISHQNMHKIWKKSLCFISLIINFFHGLAMTCHLHTSRFAQKIMG